MRLSEEEENGKENINSDPATRDNPSEERDLDISTRRGTPEFDTLMEVFEQSVEEILDNVAEIRRLVDGRQAFRLKGEDVWKTLYFDEIEEKGECLCYEDCSCNADPCECDPCGCEKGCSCCCECKNEPGD